jgi:predicted phage terminase large subunit-like protein
VRSSPSRPVIDRERLAQLANELERRALAQSTLLGFTEYTHPSWETGEHHRLICSYLERVERGEIEYLAINAPPRHSKTELASRRFPAWYLGRHPDRQLICASAAGLLAADIGANVRDIVRDTRYRNVFGEVALSEDARAAGRWMTSAGGIYYSAGVGGTIVGRGAHLAIIDDPHGGREDADSQRMRDIVGQWYYGDLITRLMTPRAVVLIMTRWHEDDLAGRVMPPEREWVRADDRGQVYRAGKWTVLMLRALDEHDHALWPGNGANYGFPAERLHSIRDEMVGAGRGREWQAQYQQRPVPDTGTYCKREWFAERWEPGPSIGIAQRPAVPLRIYMASDFAISEAREGTDPDYTEHGVFGISPDDKIYALDWWSGQRTSDVWVEELLHLVSKWKPACWFGEAGMIRRAVEPFLVKRAVERKIYFRREWVSPIQDKATRGRAFQARASMGRVVFPHASSWGDSVIAQCVAFPGAKHDDKFDVLSTLCLVIDHAHPAIADKSPKPKERDTWRRKFEQPVDEAWKIA